MSHFNSEMVLHGEKEVLLFVMDSSIDALTRHLFGIMEQLDEKPCLYITCPTIAKSGFTIPDKVLDAVYAHLPDRRVIEEPECRLRKALQSFM